MFESIMRLRAAHIIVPMTVAATVATCTADPSADPGTVAGPTSAEAQPDDEAIRPFTIEIADEVLTDLNDRLARTRHPDQIPGTGWDYGVNRAYLEELLAYWQDGFDWRAQERMLNEFDHFKTVIDGVDVHFIHQRSAEEDATPLLLTHGWPGSFVEFANLIGPLTDPAAYGGDPADAFHVVIPSLPGYGFSGKPTKTGYNPERMADVLAGLMERLGYDRYGAQGGDYPAAGVHWVDYLVHFEVGCSVCGFSVLVHLGDHFFVGFFSFLMVFNGLELFSKAELDGPFESHAAEFAGGP